MIEKDKQPAPAHLPLAKSYRLKDLPGYLGKHLSVPVGRLGVVIYRDGSSRTFPPGEHRILSAFQRLRGQGFGLKCGYVPGGDIPAGTRFAGLLSGDAELLDARLVCALDVQDAIGFFSTVVYPRGEVRESVLELEPLLLQEVLSALTIQYAASDLEQGLLSTRLSSQLRPHLILAIGRQGLRLKDLQALIFWRAQNRAVIAQKTQELAELLKEVELNARLAEIENQAQLDEFLQQVAPGLQQVAHLNLDAGPDDQAQGDSKGWVADLLLSWLGLEAVAGKRKPTWWLGNLFQKKQAAAGANKAGAIKTGRPKAPRLPANWWLSPVLAIALIFGLAYSVSRIVEWLMPNADIGDRLQFHLGIWTVAIPFIFERLIALYKKWEDINDVIEHQWKLPGYQQLDNLVGNDRRWADDLVREECSREMLHICEMVEEMRSMEFRRGNSILALKLRNEVEVHAREVAKKVQRRDYGQPPYTGDLFISRNAWLHMLDFDEDLILEVHALGDQAKLLQQNSHTGALTEGLVEKLNAGISEFGNHFFERGRPLQAGPDQAES